MSRREFLMLANKYKDQDVSGWWLSEKLDGTRCFWDGGVSRGVATTLVPWANIYHPKTGLIKTKIKPVATGLWSRLGNPIIAPDNWLNRLPSCPLDGELFAGRGRFQTCRSIVAGDVAGPEWDQIRYCVFGSPSFGAVFGDGEIKNPNFAHMIDFHQNNKFFEQRKYSGVLEDFKALSGSVRFDEELRFLLEMVTTEHDVVDMIPQAQLPDDKDEARKTLDTLLGKFLDVGGEGLVLRCNETAWQPKRVKGLLKVKADEDSEGVVTGFVSGRETDKGSKLLGLIGALILDFKGQRLELSGLTNLEREFESIVASDWAHNNPGKDLPPTIQGKHFKIGDTVTFKYNGLSDAGLPKFARYWRKR